MNTREKLLALVFDCILSEFGRLAVLEHNDADYVVHCRQPGKPVARWSFNGAEFVREGCRAPLYARSRFFFHIDEANNRAIIVLSGAMSGRGCIIDGATGEYLAYWRS